MAYAFSTERNSSMLCASQLHPFLPTTTTSFSALYAFFLRVICRTGRWVLCAIMWVAHAYYTYLLYPLPCPYHFIHPLPWKKEERTHPFVCRRRHAVKHFWWVLVFPSSASGLSFPAFSLPIFYIYATCGGHNMAGRGCFVCYNSPAHWCGLLLFCFLPCIFTHPLTT